MHVLPNLITELKCRDSVIVSFACFQIVPQADLMDSLFSCPWLWRNETENLAKINFLSSEKNV